MIKKMKNISKTILFKIVVYSVFCIPTGVSYSAKSQRYYEKQPYKEPKTIVVAENSFQQMVRALVSNNRLRLRSLIQKSFDKKLSAEVDCYNNTLLHYAAAFADLETLLFVLEYYGYNKDTTNNFGYTPLMVAEERKNQQAIKVLTPLTKYCSNACSSRTRFEFNYNLENRIDGDSAQHQKLSKSLLLAALGGIAFGALVAWLINLNNHDI